MSRPVQLGSINQSTVVRIVDSTTGDPEQGVVAATSGLALWYRREGGTKTAIAGLNNLATLDAAHNDGGLLHIDDGYYRVDPPDASWAVGASAVVVGGVATGMTIIAAEHALQDLSVEQRLSTMLDSRAYADPTIKGVWPLTELPNTTAGNFLDRSGFGNHGTLVGSATTELGRLKLTGGHVDCGNDPSLGITGTAVYADVVISDTAGEYEAWPEIVQSVGTPNTWWYFYRTTTSGGDEHNYDSSGKLVCKKATDDRVTWGAEVVVMNQAGIDDANAAVLCYDNDGTETLLAVVAVRLSLGVHRVYYTKSTDDGATWSSPVQIGEADTQLACRGNPILLSNGQIAVALYNSTAGITYCYKTDKDVSTWTSVQIEGSVGDETTLTEIKTNGVYQGAVYAWTRDNAAKFWLTKGTAYGAAWGTPAEETQLPVPSGTPLAMLRTTEDVLLTCYTTDEADGVLSFYESYDEGITWYFKTSPQKMRGVSAYPSIVQPSHNPREIALAWCVNAPSASSVYLDKINYPSLLPDITPWFTVAVTIQRSSATTDTILATDSASAPDQWCLRLDANGTLKLFFGGQILISSVAAVGDTNPHRIVVVATDRRMELFIDGVQEEAYYQADMAPAEPQLDFLIGASHDGSGGTTNPFAGVIDDVLCQVGRAWSLREIQADFEYHFLANRLKDVLDQIGGFEGGGDTALSKLSLNQQSVGDVYYADIYATVDDNNTQDEYTVQWYKNGAPVIGNITSATIQVVTRADGTDLIASTGLTQIGTTGAYKYDEATAANRLTPGESAIAYVVATIDGEVHRWRRVVGRDI